MTKLPKLFMGMALLFTFIFTFAGIGTVQPNTAFAAGECGDISFGDGMDSINCKNGNVDTINKKIYKFVQIISGLVLGVAVLMIVYAGFKYATSQGDPKQTESAKMQIISAGIGIGISMLAFVLLNIFKTVFNA